jgi:thiol-disulfide isomerase/thioredoxin
MTDSVAPLDAPPLAARSQVPAIQADPAVGAVPPRVKQVFVLLAALALSGLFGARVLRQQESEAERIKAGAEADDLDGSPGPTFRLPARGGGVVDLALLRGRLVLVNFWATWCPPCRQEEPSLQQMARSFDPSSLQVVAVSVDDAWAPIEQFFADHQPAYLVAWDEGATTSLAYGTSKFPESYLLDGQGRQVLKFVGPRNWMDPNVVATLEQLGARRSSGPR